MIRSALYASRGSVLMHYAVDTDACALEKRADLKLPGNVQYAWPHSSMPLLYVCCSSKTSRQDTGSNHYICTLKIDKAHGGLSMHGNTLRLPHRPIHITADIPGRHVLVAFNEPSSLLVFKLEADGTLGDEVRQRPDLDCGIYPHQIRVTPDNRAAILVTRGNPPKLDEPIGGAAQKDPGALKVFEYRDGILGKETSVTVGDGLRYGARHVDFPPAGPWIFVSLETQNKLYVHIRNEDEIESEPVFTRETLANPDMPGHQGAGAIHFHPNGHVAYCVNRGSKPQAYEGQKVVLDPDNTLAVFSVNPATGEPTLVQHIDSAGICPRTFSIDPTGRMLVAANAEAHSVKHGSGEPVQSVPANLAIFRVLADGKLEFKRKYDVELGPGERLYWVGIVPVPG